MNRLALKNDAKRDLQGRLFEALIPVFVMLVIGVIAGVLAGFAEIQQPVVAIIFLVILWLFLVALAVVSFSLNIGIARYYINFVKGEKTSWNTIFEDVKKGSRVWEEFKAMLVINIFVYLGMICFIIPGIYLSLRYSQTAYIFATNPDITRKEAMARSKQMMDGHIWELFVLQISFFFWYLLIMVTFGLAVFYVEPYMQCTLTRYHLSLAEVTFGKADDGANTASSGGDAVATDTYFGDSVERDEEKRDDYYSPIDGVVEDDSNPFEE